MLHLLLLLLLLLQWTAASGSRRRALELGAQDANSTGPSWKPDKFSSVCSMVGSVSPPATFQPHMRTVCAGMLHGCTHACSAHMAMPLEVHLMQHDLLHLLLLFVVLAWCCCSDGVQQGPDLCTEVQSQCPWGPEGLHDAHGPRWTR